MAERRMFAKKIVDSDAFLDLPLSAQALYFHLGMHADDDGFLNNANRIKRTIGAHDKDLEILLEKRFLLLFPSGVLVVKHWKMNNHIKGDRYRPTQYQEEYQRLKIKANKAYTDRTAMAQTEAIPVFNEENEPENPSGSSLDPEGRTDEFNLAYYSVEKESSFEEDPMEKCREVMELYHKKCISYPPIKRMTAVRRTAIAECLKSFSTEEIGGAFEIAESSGFLKNHGGNWITDFDWIIKVENMEKILEGKYTDRKTQKVCGKRELDYEEKLAIKNMMGDY